MSLHFEYKGFNLSPEVYYMDYRYGDLHRGQLDVDATVSYTFLKDFTISVVGYRLLRLRSDRWYESSVSDYSTTTTLYHSLPGHVLASLIYRF